MRTLNDAITFASTLHAGQVDKIEEPYILHSLRVMLRLETEEERIVGVLHDVLEDCGVSANQLIRMGYSKTVVSILQYVTKLPEEEHDYPAFIRRIASGPITAIRVKLADIADNTDPNRCTKDDERTRARMKKYALAKDVLEAELEKRK